MSAVVVRDQAELDAALVFDAGVRLARLTNVDPVTDCWVWQGTNDGRYGRMSFAGRPEMAHRVALALTTGGFRTADADHLCRNTLCVNPRHLEWVTHLENVRRKPTRDHCKHGHPWTPENTGVTRRGHKWCRECNRIACRRRTVRVLTEEVGREGFALAVGPGVRAVLALGRWSPVASYPS